MTGMKKITRLLAVSLAAGGVFALAACGSGNGKTTTSPNWNVSVGQNDLTENSVWLQQKEVAAYSISYKAGANNYYSYEYDTTNSTYTTEFYATTYDWSDASVPERYRTDETTVEYVYVYTTSLSISGTLTHKSSGENYSFTDSVETVCYFRSADDNLLPVYSKQDVKSTAPANLSSGSVSASFMTIDRVYESFYSSDGKQAVVKTTVRAGDTSATAGESEQVVSGLRESGYSLFDTNMREIALRSFSYGSHTYSEFIPINGGVSTFTSSSTGSTALNKNDLGDENTVGDSVIVNALNTAKADDNYIFVGETDTDGDTVYRYNAVTSTPDSPLNGSSPTYYFVNVANTQVNAGRAVMIKKVTPIYFASGTLTYSLSSLQRKTV